MILYNLISMIFNLDRTIIAFLSCFILIEIMLSCNNCIIAYKKSSSLTCLFDIIFLIVPIEFYQPNKICNIVFIHRPIDSLEIAII